VASRATSRATPLVVPGSDEEPRVTLSIRGEPAAVALEQVLDRLHWKWRPVAGFVVARDEMSSASTSATAATTAASAPER